MSSSRHPRALSVEQWVGDATKLLAVVMCLPLVDGVFPALVLAGALDSAVGIVEVGLLVFGGSATVAIILAEMDGTPSEQVRTIIPVGVLVMIVAVLEAALAPTIAGVLNLLIFERFAAVVILAIAAKTASARIGEFLPRPAVIVGLGLVASINFGGVTLAIDADPVLMARALAASGVGVGFALLVAVVSPWLRNAVDLDRFRFGSAVALAVLALSLLPVGIVPSDAPLALAVLAMTAVLSFNPGRAREPEWEYEPDHIDVTKALSDGGGETAPGGTEEPADPPEEVVEYEGERQPWL
jgi:hypothetical protein